MNTPVSEMSVRHERTVFKTVASGSIAEVMGGVGAMVLAIIALAGAGARYIGPIAVIGVAAALFLEGAAMGARYLSRLRHISMDAAPHDEVGLGISVEFIAGAAGVILGILALAGVAIGTLVSAAMVALGAALVLSSGASSRLSRWNYLGAVTDVTAERVVGELSSAAVGAQLFLGFATVVLGILGLIGIYPITLSMVGVLCAGASVILTGTTVGSRMVSLLHG